MEELNLFLGVEYYVYIRIALAFVVGMILGFERSLKRKNASIKTAVVITVASCLLTIVSIEASQMYAEAYTRPMDPLRLAAQIVSGIGFLGAGLIMAKNQATISGLTTAAIMWSSAGFGIAIGAGFFKEAIVALLFVIVGIEIMPYIAKWLGPKQLSTRRIEIELELSPDVNATSIIQRLKEYGMKLGQMHLEDLKDGKTQLHFEALIDEKIYITQVHDHIKKIDGVISIDIKGL